VLNAVSQDIIVIGQVFSAEDGAPVSGASVWFSGTKIGATTNEEGYFFLQSPQMEKAVIVSMLGYKRREAKLDKSRRDQMLEIYLKEDRSILDEIIVTPNKAEINRILKSFHQNRAKNNPENFSGFELEKSSLTRLYLSNIRQKWLQKKIFSELKAGILQIEDSTLIMPIHLNILKENKKYFEKEIIDSTLFSENKTVELFGNEQLNLILGAYISQANFYKNTIDLFGKSFLSPTAKNGNLYYDYFIVDTIYIDGVKNYEIRFRPKNAKNLTFDGTMRIDAANFALTKVTAALPKSVNLNYVNSLVIEQDFTKLDTTKYFYKSVNQDISFNYNFTFDKNQNYISAILNQKSDYENLRLLSDSVKVDFAENEMILSPENRSFSSTIDTINAAKIQKAAAAIVDIIMNGYIHAGKVDFGPVANFVRYNALEGLRLTLSMRTSEKLNKNFTVGGYIGHSYADRKLKYGGEIQARFGAKKRNTIGLFYDNDVQRFGYGDALLLNENMVSGENIFTSFSWGQQYNKLLHSRKAEIKYGFEKRGIRFSLNARAAKIYENPFLHFQKDDMLFLNINLVSATANLRMSFKESSLDNFFHRYYLSTKYPIINIQAEYGFYDLHNSKNEFISFKNPYLKLKLTVKQTVTFPLGKFNYALETSKLFGNAPYILLESPTSIRGLWYNAYNFDLVNQNEFLADTYISAYLKYYSNGLIFNNIPYIKKLNLRETAFVNIAWGGIFGNHSSILDMPQHKNLNIPYIEAGIGITNILRFLSIESVWRITHREEMKWGIRAKVYLDF
jgi:hypothetical protein